MMEIPEGKYESHFIRVTPAKEVRMQAQGLRGNYVYFIFGQIQKIESASGACSERLGYTIGYDQGILQGKSQGIERLADSSFVTEMDTSHWLAEFN
jgi:hypothetical protein